MVALAGREIVDCVVFMLREIWLPGISLALSLNSTPDGEWRQSVPFAMVRTRKGLAVMESANIAAGLQHSHAPETVTMALAWYLKVRAGFFDPIDP